MYSPSHSQCDRHSNKELWGFFVFLSWKYWNFLLALLTDVICQLRDKEGGESQWIVLGRKDWLEARY